MKMQFKDFIKAEPFRYGLEDGISKENGYVPAYGYNCKEDSISKKYPRYHEVFEEVIDGIFNNTETEWKFYIDTEKGRVLVDITDIILTTSDGNKYSCKKEIYEKEYELEKSLNI